MNECWNCELWNDSHTIMNLYGEGCGRCNGDGQITFCSHKCPLCIPKDKKVK